jgi:hypothetical protein
LKSTDEHPERVQYPSQDTWAIALGNSLFRTIAGRFAVTIVIVVSSSFARPHCNVAFRRRGEGFTTLRRRRRWNRGNVTISLGD